MQRAAIFKPATCWITGVRHGLSLPAGCFTREYLDGHVLKHLRHLPIFRAVLGATPSGARSAHRPPPRAFSPHPRRTAQPSSGGASSWAISSTPPVSLRRSVTPRRILPVINHEVEGLLPFVAHEVVFPRPSGPPLEIGLNGLLRGHVQVDFVDDLPVCLQFLQSPHGSFSSGRAHDGASARPTASSSHSLRMSGYSYRSGSAGQKET